MQPPSLLGGSGSEIAMIVFHLHVPRTGGTACAHSLRDGFTRERFVKFRSVQQVEQDAKIGQDLVVVSGHFYWGLHERFGRDHLYFIVLRDPVERAASTYDYVVARTGHKYQPLWARTSLHQLLAQNRSTSQLSNWQVRQIAAGEQRRAPVSASTLERAWRHLSQENVIVGFTDTLNDGLQQLGARTGIHFKQLRQKHNAARRSSLSEETLELLRRANAFDIELYSRAREAFEHQPEKPAAVPLVAPVQAFHENIVAHPKRDVPFDNLSREEREASLLRGQERLPQSRTLPHGEQPPKPLGKLTENVRQAIRKLIDSAT